MATVSLFFLACTGDKESKGGSQTAETGDAGDTEGDTASGTTSGASATSSAVTAGETATTGTSASESTGASEPPESCIDAVTLSPGEERDMAEEACATWLLDDCGVLGMWDCSQAEILGIPDTGVEIRCLWHDTWTGTADASCERGAVSARCIGALYAGDGGVGGPYYRAEGDELEVVSNHDVDFPFGYASCNTGSDAPAACSCLEP